MALTIESPEAERLARELAKKNGKTVEEVVLAALKGSLPFTPTQFKPDGSAYRALTEFQEALAKLPVLDDRTADEILGYDEHGLPH